MGNVRWWNFNCRLTASIQVDAPWGASTGHKLTSGSYVVEVLRVGWFTRGSGVWENWLVGQRTLQPMSKMWVARSAETLIFDLINYSLAYKHFWDIMNVYSTTT